MKQAIYTNVMEIMRIKKRLPKNREPFFNYFQITYFTKEAFSK